MFVVTFPMPSMRSTHLIPLILTVDRDYEMITYFGISMRKVKLEAVAALY
jgi:hypothetical protein